MSDIKSPVSRAHIGRAAATRSETDKGSFGHLRPFQATLPAMERDDPSVRARGDGDAISTFTAPPRETAQWLGNPAITGALAAVSQELAPDGVAESSRNQYVASVVETHLSARRQLARHLNALLRA